MALTEFQRTVCRLIAANRKEGGESYVAGGVALNRLIQSPRISRDIDLFHDTEEALLETWRADRLLLEAHGYRVTPTREGPGFVEAEVGKGTQQVQLHWARDSAFRFFPLVTHEDFGLTLHPFDLATNKVLALVGRLEVRDWLDVIRSHERIQPLGYLAWAACGKDPGYSPSFILEQAARTTHYSKVELEELAFEGSPPEIQQLSQNWRQMLAEAREIVALLSPDEVGKCVLDREGRVFCGHPLRLRSALAENCLQFHFGSIRGALPRLRPGDGI